MGKAGFSYTGNYVYLRDYLSRDTKSRIDVWVALPPTTHQNDFAIARGINSKFHNNYVDNSFVVSFNGSSRLGIAHVIVYWPVGDWPRLLWQGSVPVEPHD